MKIHPLVQEISYIQDDDLEKGVKVNKKFTCLKSVTRISSLMNIHSFVQEIYHFSNKITFCQLASDLENEVKVTKL